MYFPHSQGSNNDTNAHVVPDEDVDADRGRRSTIAEATMRPPTTVSTAQANPGIKHFN